MWLGCACSANEDSAASDPASDAGTHDAAPLILGEPEVVLYAEQPMVVDLRLATSEPATATVRVPADLGVRSETLGTSTAPELRLRGLAPGTTHTIEVTAEAGERSETRSLEIETLPASFGHLSSFSIAGQSDSSAYLLFDLSNFPLTTLSGLFAVDMSGTTRFYLPMHGKAQGAISIPAGLRLRDDGTLLFLQDHELRVVDEMGSDVLRYSDDQLGTTGMHHDVIELPNGNFLVVAFSFRDVFYPDENLTRLVAGDAIHEVTPAGDVVWTWDTFDHLDPLRTREGFELTVGHPETGDPGADWTHGNGVVYSSEDDSILFSMRHQDWIVKISRASGEIEWRLGPGGDFALESGTWFHHQHSPEWQPDGTLLLYDNGVSNPDVADDEERSRPVVYELDFDAMVARQVWEEASEPFFTEIAGDVDRLANGNVLALDSAIPTDPLKPFDEVSVRWREIRRQDSSVVWSMTTGVGLFAYRTTVPARLPGERL